MNQCLIWLVLRAVKIALVCGLKEKKKTSSLANIVFVASFIICKITRKQFILQVLWINNVSFNLSPIRNRTCPLCAEKLTTKQGSSKCLLVLNKIKKQFGFHGEHLQIETSSLELFYFCYAIWVFLTDFIEVFLRKSISANVQLTVLCHQYISGVQSGNAGNGFFSYTRR